MKVNKHIKFKGTKYEVIYWMNSKGQYHREDGPAVMYTRGRNMWFLNGDEYFEEDEYKEEMYKRNLKKLNGSD